MRLLPDPLQYPGQDVGRNTGSARVTAGVDGCEDACIWTSQSPVIKSKNTSHIGHPYSREFVLHLIRPLR